jgi:hypothetical protein
VSFSGSSLSIRPTTRRSGSPLRRMIAPLCVSSPVELERAECAAAWSHERERGHAREATSLPMPCLVAVAAPRPVRAAVTSRQNLVPALRDGHRESLSRR